MGGVGFEVTGNVTFQERCFYNMYYRKINNYTLRTNRMNKNGLYACLISVFMDNHEIYKFWIFEFFIFLFSKSAILAYFDPK